MSTFGIFRTHMNKPEKEKSKWSSRVVMAVSMIVGVAFMRFVYVQGYESGQADAHIKPITVSCKDGEVDIDMGDSYIDDPNVLEYFVKAIGQDCIAHNT